MNWLRVVLVASITILSAIPLQAQESCGTIPPTEQQKQDLMDLVEDYIENNGPIDIPLTSIPVVMHVVRPDAVGWDVTDNQINDQIAVLNDAFAATKFQFYLQDINREVNSAWQNPFPTSPAEEAMKNALSVTPASTLNFYICDAAGGVDTKGYAWFPSDFSDESDTRHGVVVVYSTLPGGDWVETYQQDFPGFDPLYYNEGDTGTHEVGHFLGLLHVFSEVGDCGDTGDLVADTPPCLKPVHPSNGWPHTGYWCLARDTCASDGLNDPIHNFMDYSDDKCQDHFTPGQAVRMEQQMRLHRGTMIDDNCTDLPTADFSAPQTGHITETFAFTDFSTGPPGKEPFSWYWTFGDGSTSTEQTPSHTYQTAGTFDVTLTVWNKCGGHKETKSSYITVNCEPIVDFHSIESAGYAPLEVNFIDDTQVFGTNQPNWSWTFGEGGTSNEQNPTYIYTIPGVHNVQLTVTDDCGIGVLTKSGYIEVFDPDPANPIYVSDALQNLDETITNAPEGAKLYFTEDLQPFGPITIDINKRLIFEAAPGQSPIILRGENTLGEDVGVLTDFCIFKGISFVHSDVGTSSPTIINIGNSNQFTDCFFQAYANQAVGIANWGSDLLVTGSRFEGFSSFGISSPISGSMSVEKSVFVSCGVKGNSGGIVTVKGCIFDSAETATSTMPIGSTIEENVFLDCTNIFVGVPEFEARYNLFYPNTNIQPPPHIDNLYEDPYFCNGREGTSDYGLRWDSPCAPGNNSWGVHIGGQPVECAWGDLTRDAIVPAASVVTILEDAEVPVGLKLTLSSNVTLQFDPNDESSSGFYSDKNELVVRGELIADDLGGPGIVITSAVEPPAPANWGVLTAWDTSEITLKNVTIEYSDEGFMLASSNVNNTLEQVTFQNNATHDMRFDNNSFATITDCTFDVEGVDGVILFNAQNPAFSDCFFTASNGIHGLVFALSSGTVTLCDFSGFSTGSAVLAKNSTAPTITSSTFGSNKYSMEWINSAGGIVDNCDFGTALNGYSYDIWIKDTANPSIQGNDFNSQIHPHTGIRTEDTAAPTITGNTIDSLLVGVSSQENSAPSVHGNTLTGCTTAIKVAATSEPDLGTVANPGNNNITGGTWHVYSKRRITTLYAEQNYWGGVPNPSKFSNNVDYTPWLSSPPSSKPDLPDLDDGKIEERVIPGLRVFPNPTRGSVAFRFSGPEASATGEVKIFDIQGRQVTTLDFVGGRAEWNSRNDTGAKAATGIYLYRLTIGNQQQVGRITILP